jgi:hypothetical protein
MTPEMIDLATMGGSAIVGKGLHLASMGPQGHLLLGGILLHLDRCCRICWSARCRRERDN